MGEESCLCSENASSIGLAAPHADTEGDTQRTRALQYGQPRVRKSKSELVEKKKEIGRSRILNNEGRRKTKAKEGGR
jgi:hypothetical protein